MNAADDKRRVAIFANHAEAQRATHAYYRGLTGSQRLEILLELIGRWRDQHYGAVERLERVYRVVERGRR